MASDYSSFSDSSSSDQEVNLDKLDLDDIAGSVDDGDLDLGGTSDSEDDDDKEEDEDY